MNSLEYLQQSAIAIFFYDFTNTVQTLLLREKLLEKEKQNKSLNMSQMMLSHEFRAPLASTLMVLQTLLETTKDEPRRKIILIVISQINLLLYLVNDILDLKMLDQNKFISRQEEFNVAETIKFVISIFDQ